MVLLNKLLKCWFDEIFFQWVKETQCDIFTNLLSNKKQIKLKLGSQCSVVKWKIHSHQKKISSNQLFSNFFSKNVAFTKFLPKKCESKFL